MKSLSEATLDDRRIFLTAVAEGQAPAEALLSTFDLSEDDAEVVAQRWLNEFKTEQPFGDEVLTQEILTKEGALKRLAVLALFGAEEETQRKAVMDIAKLQKWVDESHHISQTVLTGTMQEGKAFLLAHKQELEAMLHEAERDPVPRHP